MRTLFIFAITFFMSGLAFAQTWKDCNLSQDKLQGKIAFPVDVRKQVSSEGDLAVYTYESTLGNDDFSLVVKVAKTDFPAGTAEQKFREVADGAGILPNTADFEGSPSYSAMYNGGNAKLHIVVVKNVLYMVKYNARMTYSSKKANQFFGSFTTKNAKSSSNNGGSTN